MTVKYYKAFISNPDGTLSHHVVYNGITVTIRPNDDGTYPAQYVKGVDAYSQVSDVFSSYEMKMMRGRVFEIEPLDANEFNVDGLIVFIRSFRIIKPCNGEIGK